MNAMYVLAQQAADETWIDDLIEASAGLTTALGYEIALHPAVGLPIVLVVLWLTALVLRSLLGTWFARVMPKSSRRASSRTR